MTVGIITGKKTTQHAIFYIILKTYFFLLIFKNSEKIGFYLSEESHIRFSPFCKDKMFNLFLEFLEKVFGGKQIIS